MTVGQWLRSVHRLCTFQSTERPGLASNSELERWITQGALWLNGVACRTPNVPVPELQSVVLFPRGVRKTTLWEV